MPDREELMRQGIAFTGVESQNNTYYIDVDSIDTTGLYFGDAPDEATDGLGVSFSGVTTLENHYVIDGEDPPGITVDRSYTRDIHIEIDETDAFQEAE